MCAFFTRVCLNDVSPCAWRTLLTIAARVILELCFVWSGGCAAQGHFETVCELPLGIDHVLAGYSESDWRKYWMKMKSGLDNKPSPSLFLFATDSEFSSRFFCSITRKLNDFHTRQRARNIRPLRSSRHSIIAV